MALSSKFQPQNSRCLKLAPCLIHMCLWSEFRQPLSFLLPPSLPPQVVSGLPSDRANQYSPSLSRTANIQKPFLFPFLLRSSVKDKLNKPLAEWQGAAAGRRSGKQEDRQSGPKTAQQDVRENGERKSRQQWQKTCCYPKAKPIFGSDP